MIRATSEIKAGAFPLVRLSLGLVRFDLLESQSHGLTNRSGEVPVVGVEELSFQGWDDDILQGANGVSTHLAEKKQEKPHGSCVIPRV